MMRLHRDVRADKNFNRLTYPPPSFHLSKINRQLKKCIKCKSFQRNQESGHEAKCLTKQPLNQEPWCRLQVWTHKSSSPAISTCGGQGRRGQGVGGCGEGCGVGEGWKKCDWQPPRYAKARPTTAKTNGKKQQSREDMKTKCSETCANSRKW